MRGFYIYSQNFHIYKENCSKPPKGVIRRPDFCLVKHRETEKRTIRCRNRKPTNGSESCRTRSLRKFDASKNERSGDRSSREMDEAARDFPLIASSWPMISTNVALYIVIGSIFYVLLPWTVIICGKKKKFPEVTKSMMTTVKSVPTANPSVSGSQPIVPVKPATPDTAAGSAPNTSTDPVKKEEKDGKKETGSEEKKVEKKDEAGKDDVKSDKKVEGKKDADKEKSGKSKKPSGAEEGDGYEDCPDMTPEQLEKLCKDNDKQ